MNGANLLAVEGNQKLYHEIENDTHADWIIEAKDEVQFKVHPIILKPRSDFLKNLMNSDFKEKKDKKIVFSEFTSTAVKYFIKFMYGFDLKNDADKYPDLNTLKELVRMGDMYLVKRLRDAAIVSLDMIQTTSNALEILQFKKEQSLSLDSCLHYIVKNLNFSELRKKGDLKKFPEIALTIIEHLHDAGQLTDYTVKTYCTQTGKKRKYF